MAIHGLTLSATKSYVSDLDPGKGKDGAEVTTFTLGPVDVFVTSQIFDRGVDFNPGEGGTRVNMSAMNIDYVRFGLRDMVGYVGGDKVPMKFETELRYVSGRPYSVIKDEILATFPQDLIRELGSEIKELSTVSQDEAKNS